MFEGYGGPVRMDQYSTHGIDPSLDSCCQREIEENRSRTALEATLRRHDRIALAERRRRDVIQNMSFGDGCRCCYDPTEDGGDYPALAAARSRLATAIVSEVGGTKGYEEKEDAGGYCRSISSSHSSDSDSDSDSEFDYLLDETLPAESNHQSDRMEELKLAALIQESARSHGFGTHRQMAPKRALSVCGLLPPPTKPSRRPPPFPAPACVLHLFDPTDDRSVSLDLCLESLAETVGYRGTRFVRSNGRATAMLSSDGVLPPLKMETDLPALIAVKDGAVVTISKDLSGLGSVRDGTVEPRAVEEWLTRAGVLLKDVPVVFEEYCRIRPEETALLENMMREKTKLDEMEEIEGKEEEEVYLCGVAGCQKTFRHEHVGVANEHQSGLVVSEEETIGGKAD